MDDIQCVDEAVSQCIAPGNREEFNAKYEAFMARECDNNFYPACLSYGDFLSQRDDFDLASKAYVKAANNGNEAATSRLYYLYSNQHWDGHSDEKSEYWLDRLTAEQPN
ncbi:hypothetical protein [Gilvimarinus sp. DA14]|uniref:hypothetical protein n=1 Tax=Gilvimarinus sp. DA14 TaxID=2956798 RepID=UPI0020B6EE86|nr:hypothetical protein [Gilvimarinus sp. DA14]UTF60459.1 hypothetical protein NHM04_01295 [Gilvimarinus sp. DA14]